MVKINVNEKIMAKIFTAKLNMDKLKMVKLTMNK